ncbi:MAG: hypothetical protein AB8B51_02370 [Sedimentitalea sp.]
MSVNQSNRKGIVATCLLLVMFSLPLGAQVSDPDADVAPAAPPAEAVPAPDLQDETELLAALATADLAESRKFDRQLQALWSKSGSPSLDLLLKRGRDAMEVENTRAAIEHLTALTDHAPDFAEGWHARASAFFNADLFGPAMADLERALSLNPNNYNAIYGLGAILETFGDEKRAYEAYKRASDLHPHHEDISKALVRLELRVRGKAL